jgi:hypothetical protein
MTVVLEAHPILRLFPTASHAATLSLAIAHAISSGLQTFQLSSE